VGDTEFEKDDGGAGRRCCRLGGDKGVVSLARRLLLHKGELLTEGAPLRRRSALEGERESLS